MTSGTIKINGITYPVLSLTAAVIGSGAAGYNALDTLNELGVKDIALFTEGRKLGTSRNTGSDKQTYYKLSLCGSDGDSVGEMAETLFAGSGVNGDTALSEAAGSVKAFMKLCRLGVQFPTNEYGEYVGYKTDHDPRTRATSAGPLTSKFMTEALEKEVNRKALTVFDGYLVTDLLVEENRLYGFIALNKAELGKPHRGLTAVLAPYVVLATGGPAGCYEASVYPESQWGMSGMALASGAIGANLSEWQYGLASVDFRWNVSGTYQQVLPRYISIDDEGTEREFLPEYFASPEEALAMEFLKGYQWPFDAAKIPGSSLVDLAVYRETVELGRKVYMDFRTNPTGYNTDFSGLSAEAATYLTNSGANQATPFERLKHMNPAAIELYRSHKIDLETEALRIAVCAQHHNGGIAVDANWESNISGLFVAGEAAGNFGVHRPGGSALNATQVGSARAAEEIERRLRRAAEEENAAALRDVFEADATLMAGETLEELAEMIDDCREEEATVAAERHRAQAKMSAFAAELRNPAEIEKYEKELRRGEQRIFWSKDAELTGLFKLRDMLVTQEAVLNAMKKAAEEFGSRGSALVVNLSEETEGDYLPEKQRDDNKVLYTVYDGYGFRSYLADARPIPAPDNWFENVWAEYRKRNGIR